jgi:hypothetical protein
MSITKLTQHDSHKVSVHRCKPDAVHFAALRCVDCNKHIQWLSKEDFFAVADDCLVSFSTSFSLGREAEQSHKNGNANFIKL